MGNGAQFKCRLTLVALGFVALSSCTPSTSGKPGLGVVLSLSGNYEAYGQPAMKGIRAAELVARNRGMKLPTVAVQDAGSNPASAVNAIRKVIADGATVVIGDVASGTSLAMAPIAERSKVVFLAPGASNPSFSEAGDYVFRNWTSDNFDGNAMANYLQNINVKNVAIVSQQTDYSEGLAAAFAAQFKKFGGTVVLHERFPSDVPDFRTLLLRVASKSPAAVYLVAESLQLGRLLAEARPRLPNAKFYSNLSVDRPECAQAAGGSREGVVFTTPAFDVDSKQPEVVDFVKTYAELNKGEKPDIVAATAYDAFMILATGMSSGAGLDSSKVKSFLYSLKRYPGVTGETSFDDKGDVVKNVFVKEIRSGKPELVREFRF